MDRALSNQLMLSAARGDRSALDKVMRALWPIVHAWSERWVGRSDASDVTQKALMKLAAAAADFDREGDVIAWALTLATWECRTLRRRHKKTTDTDALTSSAASPEEAVMNEELLRHAEDLLGLLSENERETLQQALADDPAKHFSNAAFRKRKQRLLDRLRTLWRTQHEPS